MHFSPRSRSFYKPYFICFFFKIFFQQQVLGDTKRKKQEKKQGKKSYISFLKIEFEIKSSKKSSFYHSFEILTRAFL